MSANDRQVGGDHYKQENTPQHWDVVIALNWDYLTGAATKYLWRLGRKGDEAKAIEDITKAIHYLEKKREVMIAAIENQPVEWRMPVAVAKAWLDADDNTADLFAEPTAGYVNQDR
jgi:hypothetical protein